MHVLLDENLSHKITMTSPLYTLRSAPIHRDSKLERRQGIGRIGIL